MDKKRSTHTSTRPKLAHGQSATKAASRKARGDCDDSESSSHTHIFRREKYRKEYKRITSDEFVGISESISGSSDTFQCVHGPEGKLYTPEGRLKRNLVKELDPIRIPRKWTIECKPAGEQELAQALEFLVTDAAGQQLTDRIETYLRDLAATTRHGYNIKILNSLCVVLDYLMDNLKRKPNLREGTILLLKNMDKPILLTLASDVVSQFDTLTRYVEFLGSLLVITEEDEMFELVARALTWQLSAGGEARGAGTARRQLVLGAARALMHTAPRMLALASSRRFPTFLQIALLLACDSDDYCIEMIKENIIENIFYRFNPYFPHDELPAYEFDPADPQDYNVKLGDSSINMATTLSLLLVLLQTLKNHLNVNPNCRAILPCPNYYAQRCFIWAYRFECRAREHRHERSALTVVAHALLHCFGDRLVAFSSLLMPDVMTLSVLTEIPRRRDWTGTVNFNTSQADVNFKKLLIHLCVDFLKILPANSFMVECRHWLLGLMFLLDPCLSPLRAHWSPALFAEIRKTGLQALVCTLPIIPQRLIQEYDIIRRVLWYIEWYSESPYELPTLYWSVRLLRAATRDRQESLDDLFNTHGVIILTHLCYTLLEQKRPPVERSQAVLALVLRVLAETGEERSLRCCVYALRWPAAGCALAHRMLAVVLFALNNHLIITDRWLLSLLNFIWEAIVWNKEHRQTFVLKNGVYNLLDIIAMSKPAVQCLALALLCELARGGDAAAQLVTWRAGLAPSGTYPCVAKCGSSIACLLAAVFRDECLSSGVLLDERGVIQNIDSPLQSLELRNEMNNLVYREAKSDRTPVCWPAADAAGSRASKAFALLQLLSEDLKHKVALADETYNLYKNIRLEPEDEVILVLCSHYLTIKLNETWVETKLQSPGLLIQDEIILDEFLEINKGWAEEIRRQQLDVLEKNHKKEAEEESTLYEFLRRVRLTSALDALREVRCAASSASAPRRARPTVAVAPSDSGASLVRTYRPPLDEQNVTGQYVKLYSIQPKNKQALEKMDSQ